MENNELKQKVILKEKSNVQPQMATFSLNVTNINHNLTNEQKLDSLSKLIQDAEQNLEFKDIRKKLLKKSKTI